MERKRTMISLWISSFFFYTFSFCLDIIKSPQNKNKKVETNMYEDYSTGQIALTLNLDFTIPNNHLATVYGSDYNYSLLEDKYSKKKYYIPYTMYEKEQTRKYKNDPTNTGTRAIGKNKKPDINVRYAIILTGNTQKRKPMRFSEVSKASTAIA